MNVREKLIVIRVLFILLALCLTGVLIALVTILNTDASYAVPLEPNDAAFTETADAPLDVSAMPDDAYVPVRLTFGGSCTSGSMLGSSSYGTFNEMLTSNGAGYFLEKLDFLFYTDDLTLVGCDVVLSDNAEMAAADRGTLEWYRGPSHAAKIFSEGGVDVLSLHSFHTWDYGEAGYADTKAALENAGLLWGDHGKAVYFEQDGISVAMYCRYVDDETDAEAVRTWLADEIYYDYVALYITTPETGSYLPDEYRQAMFRSFAEAGADLVVGTDTAQIQPYETWGDSMILYSLGSLLDGRTKYPEPYTLLLGVELQVIDGEMQDVEYHFTPCRTYDDDHAWRPSVLNDPDEYNAVMEFLNGNRATPTFD